MPRTFKHFTYEQRCQLKSMLDNKVPVETIAETLGFHRSAIYREINKGKVDGVYNPDNSEKQYQDTLSQRGRESILSANPELAQTIADYILKDHLSPKKIADRLKTSSDTPITHNTIYNAIDNGLIPGVTRESLRSEETKVFNNGTICLASWLRDELDIKDGDSLHFEITEDKKIIFSKAGGGDD